jgi:hypothetical protein
VKQPFDGISDDEVRHLFDETRDGDYAEITNDALAFSK